jgi:NitT/TauT family transport system substrate-binding protein
MIASGALYRPLAPTTVLVARKGRPIRGARGLVGKKVAVDALNAIPHIAMRRWLKRNGVREDAVEFVPIPFPQMLAPLSRGAVDAAVIAEPYLTLASQQGATRVANVFKAVCPKICLLTGWMARSDINSRLAAQFRNAVQAASVWADQKKNRRASAAILSKYATVDAAVARRMTRAYFAQRLVPGLAQPWIDAFAEFKVIPAPFPAIQLVR